MALRTEIAKGFANLGEGTGVLPTGERPAPTPAMNNVTAPVRQTIENLKTIATPPSPDVTLQALEKNTEAMEKLTEALGETGLTPFTAGGELELKLDPTFGMAVLQNVKLGP